eukprot:CAMPEP_0172411588 /NCGR_PEP_ID=MMETSP1061-20121228/77471_1 /TAXON_ID=37318 /ORGANISM="Pseudo-nitzschia pungens, Strain cf. pungens" /LENGTH=364 /DNA_ID=CAMNT_0013147801 /DNA_START=59 /DNA_END=1150 /DNA_ORIENTATION=+
MKSTAILLVILRAVLLSVLFVAAFRQQQLMASSRSCQNHYRYYDYEYEYCNRNPDFHSDSDLGVGVGVTLLRMGGYYVEADEEKAKNIIDRSQTHMIFGSRCLETKLQLRVFGGSSSSSSSSDDDTEPLVTVVGLMPLGDDDKNQNESESESEKGQTQTEQIPSSVLTNDGDGNTLGKLLGALFGDKNNNSNNNNNTEEKQEQEPPLALVEIADPLFSIASETWLAARFGSSGAPVSIRVRHFDEDRLRILQHSRMFFNPRTTTTSVDVDVAPLETETGGIDDLLEGLAPLSTAAIVVTSSEPFAVSLLEAIEGAHAGAGAGAAPKVVVPSSFRDIHDGFEYRSMGIGGDNDNDNDDPAASEFW